MPSMMLLLAIGLAPLHGKFAVDHPDSARITGEDGRLLHASGFLADTGLRDPAESARAFLLTYSDELGLAGQSLLLLTATASGTGGVVKFSRRIGGLPVFGGDVVVGVDEEGKVFALNSGPAPAAVSGSHALGETPAYNAAIASLGGELQLAGPYAIEKGFRTFGERTRAVYRVDFIAQKPAGDWRVFVDGETGQVLFRENLRYQVSAPGKVFEVSPVEDLNALCTANFSTGIRALCESPIDVTFVNLDSAESLAGSQTTIYNCKGTDPPSDRSGVPGVCTPVASSGGGFSFPADVLAQPPTAVPSNTDDFAAAMAYYHLDKHLSFFKSLDPALPPADPSDPTMPHALRGSIPGLVNVQQGGQPLNNAFYSGLLDAMIFGQSSGADYTYDATVMYHESTHAVVFAWGGYNATVDSLGALDEPSAVNEGTADAMAVSETGHSAIGAYIAEAGGGSAVRDLSDPGAGFSCQGSGLPFQQFGVPTVNGLDGEPHDDGQIWNTFYWEIFQGMQNVGARGCNGACDAAPAIQYRTLQLSAGTAPTFASSWRTFKSATQALFPKRPSLAAYVDCVGKRRGMDKCDRTVPLFAGEPKIQFIELRFSSFQVALQATGPSSFQVCSNDGLPTKVYARQGQPVQIGDPTSANPTVTADLSQTFTNRCIDGSNATVAIPSPGTWYVLLDAPHAAPGQNPGADVFRFIASTAGMASRPAQSSPATCSLPFALGVSADATHLPPRGRIVLSGTGGSGGGYTFAMVTNKSGATVNARTGLFVAGPTPNVTDTVQVADSLGEVSTADLQITAGITITPASTSLKPGERLTFTANGGSANYDWSMLTNSSGGSIDSKGNYVTGSNGNVTDVVQVVDSVGNSATVTVTVRAGSGGKGGCSSTGTGNMTAILFMGALLALHERTRRSHRS